jgi:hypothetical protein
MKKERTQYKRRFSLEESRDRYILISKDFLSMFPRVGEPFRALINGQNKEISIEAFLCTCMGPNNSHNHYHLSFENIKPDIVIRRGGMASIRKMGDTFKIEIK